MSKIKSYQLGHLLYLFEVAGMQFRKVSVYSADCYVPEPGSVAYIDLSEIKDGKAEAKPYLSDYNALNFEVLECRDLPKEFLELYEKTITI